MPPRTAESESTHDADGEGSSEFVAVEEAASQRRREQLVARDEAQKGVLEVGHIDVTVAVHVGKRERFRA